MNLANKIANVFTSAIIKLDTFPRIYNRSGLSLPSQPRRLATMAAPGETPKYDCWMCGDAYESPADYLNHINECSGP